MKIVLAQSSNYIIKNNNIVRNQKFKSKMPYLQLDVQLKMLDYQI